MGHPTHAFDLDKIEGGIVVRLAHPGEQLKLLDGTDRTLDADDLVIADDAKPSRLAGVMGGWDSMITAETKNILVEAAWFDPASHPPQLPPPRPPHRRLPPLRARRRLQRRARRQRPRLATSSSSTAATPKATLIDVVIPAARRPHRRPPAHRALRQPSPAPPRHHPRRHPTVASPPTSSSNTSPPSAAPSPPSREATYFHVSSPPGVSTSSARSTSSKRSPASTATTASPTPCPRPASSSPTPPPPPKPPSAPACSPSATANPSPAPSPRDADSSPLRRPRPGRHPAGKSPLRRSQPAPPLARSRHAHHARPQPQPRRARRPPLRAGPDLHRLDRVRHRGRTGVRPALPRPHRRLPRSHTLHSPGDAPFFELKGAIESLSPLFTLPGGPAALTFTADAPAWLEPGRAATALLNDQPIAHFGELATAESTRRKLRQPVFLAQLDLARLYDLPLKHVTARDLSRFQAVERDFSFTFPDAVQWHTIAAALHALSHPRAQRLTPGRSLAQPQKIPRRLLPPHPHRLPVPRPHPARRRPHRLVLPHHRNPHHPGRHPPRRITRRPASPCLPCLAVTSAALTLAVAVAFALAVAVALALALCRLKSLLSFRAKPRNPREPDPAQPSTLSPPTPSRLCFLIVTLRRRRRTCCYSARLLPRITEGERFLYLPLAFAV